MRELEPKKIAFVTSIDPQDKRSWSGTFYQMAQALKRHCGEVVYVGPVHPEGKQHQRNWLRQSKTFVEKFLYQHHPFGYRLFASAHRRFIHDYDAMVAKKYAGIANQRFAHEHFDVIVSPASMTEIAFLQTEIPIVAVDDTTFALLINYYPIYTNLPAKTIRMLNAAMETGIRKASALVYASHWAAQSAIDDYEADPAKVHVVPVGANFDHSPGKELVQQKRKSSSCKLLFVGVHWQRKGGDIAFETLLALEKMGIMAELTICGCTPPIQLKHARMHAIPFLDKTDPAQYSRLEQLYMESDFFLMPTRNECYGIVFCEANAYGLPVITTQTGGIPEVIKDGENGFMLPLTARGDEYARLIASVYQDDERYARLIRTSRAAYDDHLNWDAWGKTMNTILNNVVTPQHVSPERVALRKLSPGAE